MEYAAGARSPSILKNGPHGPIFTNHELLRLIGPLLVEQLLATTVGMADTMMVSRCGEAAISGVSLVDMINNLVINLLAALATGGAVVVSQYLGALRKKETDKSAGQLILLSLLLGLGLGLFCFALARPMLRLFYGTIEADVLDAGVRYLRVTALSYPFLALYNAGAALYRCMSKTKVTMQISLVMNAINVAGNAIGIFVLHAGVAGVAWPSTLSRAFAAVAMTALCFSKKNQVRLLWKNLLTWNSSMVRRLLRIAVPNSIENGLFQLAKVALSSITAMFGTVQIAANGVAQSIWSLAALVGSAMGPAFITVVGQCMGASDTEAADYYMRKLTRLTLFVSIAWNALVLLLTPVMLLFYDLSPEAKNLVFWLVVIHNIFNAVAYPISGPFSNGLRAAGDVKFTMYISLFSTIVVRVALSIVLGVWLNLGVIGIALAMAGDWCIKAVILLFRYKSGAWKSFRVLG